MESSVLKLEPRFAFFYFTESSNDVMASLGGRDLFSPGIDPATLAIPQSINAAALATFTVEALSPVLVEFCGGWEQ